jgi:hypothetical protein
MQTVTNKMFEEIAPAMLRRSSSRCSLTCGPGQRPAAARPCSPADNRGWPVSSPQS